MAYLLFIDESGSDHQESPYETLAGICIRDINLWELVLEIKEIQSSLFGSYYQDNKKELKAKKILKTKTYRLAKQLPKFDETELPVYAQECLQNGENATRVQLTALAQAKLLYAEKAIRACLKAGGKIFVSIVDFRSIPQQPSLGLDEPNLFLEKKIQLFV